MSGTCPHPIGQCAYDCQCAGLGNYDQSGNYSLSAALAHINEEEDVE